jgi:PAS domain S-box-containing protein
MLRIGTPVFDNSGRKQGIVLLNYFGAHLLEHFGATADKDGGLDMLLNSEGYWLAGPNREDEWGFMFGNERTFGRAYPEEWRAIAHREKGVIHNERGLFVFATVYPLRASQRSSTGSPSPTGESTARLDRERYYWKIVAHTPAEALPSIWFFRQPAALALFLVALSLLAAGSWPLATARVGRARWQAALSESESRYRGLIASLPGIAYRRALDAGWTMEIMSGEARQVTGYPAADFLDKIRSYASLILADDLAMVEHAVAEGVQARRPFEIEYRLRRRGGDVVTVHEKGHGVFAPDGRLLWLDGFIWDVTERTRTERALRESEARFSMVFSSSSIGIAISRLDDGRFVDVNPALLDASGYGRDEMIGRTSLELGIWPNPDDRAAIVERLRNDGRITNLELRMQRKAGEIGLGLVSMERLDLAGEPHLLSMMIDITERKSAEEALRRTEEWLRLAQQAANVGSWEYDLATERESWSPQMASIFGVEPGVSLCHGDWLTRLHPDDLVRVKAEEVQALAERRPFLIEFRVVRPSGETRWVQGRGDAIRDADGRVVRVLGVDIDITERKQAEAALQESEERFRLFMDNSPAIAWMKDAAGRVVYINRTFERRFGVSLADWYGKTDHELWPAGIADEFRAADLAVLANDAPTELDECMLDAMGQAVYWHSLKIPFSGAGGQRYIGGMALDITERNRIVAELRESEERFRLLFENAPIGIAMADRNRRFFRVNQAFCEMLGYSPEELTRMSFTDITHPDDVGPNVDLFRQAYENNISSYHLRKRYLHSQGDVIWVNLFATLIRSPLGEPLYTVGIIENITERVNAERERLAHEASQREALVREVHHRIKNNLHGVIGLLKQDIGRYPEATVPLEAAIAQIKTVSVVHGLRGRASETELHPAELLVEIAKSVAALSIVALPPTVEDGLTGDVRLDPNATVSIALILNELIQNALKHGRNADGAGVAVSITGDAERLCIRVDNPGGPLPAGFDLATGGGCGIGLDLVRTLLPRKGTRLSISGAGDRIRAELILTPPMIAPAAACCTREPIV